MKITKDTKIADILRKNLMTVFTLKKYGMVCMDCPVKHNDTIEECAKVHEVDLEKLIDDLQKYVQ